MPRQKLDRTNLHARVDIKTPESLKKIAYILGYTYDNEGSTGQLLDAIASSEQVLIPRNTYLKLVYALKEMGDNIICGEETNHTTTFKRKEVK